MKIQSCLLGVFSSVIWAQGEESIKVTPETNAVLESSIVLDESSVVQGNTHLKIERLSTPDEDLLKDLESKKDSRDAVKPVHSVSAFLKRRSYFVSATVYDHTYTLLQFKSLSGEVATEALAWTNITSWEALGASPTFVQGDTKYTMMIMPSSAQVTDESPALPTNLPSLSEGGAYYQEGKGGALKPDDIHFMEALHEHYALEKDKIKEVHQAKVEAEGEKEAAKEKEARQKKTVTLRFWRQEDKPKEMRGSE